MSMGLLFLFFTCLAQAQEQARQSDAFVETIGIGGRWDHAYADGTFPDLQSALQKLKIRYIRGGVVGELNNGTQEGYNAAMKQMATDLNVKMCGLVEWNHPDVLRAAIDRLGTALYALEGPNEAYGAPGWADPFWQSKTSVDVQKFIWDYGRPKGLDIYSWTLGGPMSGYECCEHADGYLETNLYSTHANAHPYHWYVTPGVRQTTKVNGLWQDAESSNNKGMVDVLRRVMQNPTKRLVATEWGWAGDKWPEDRAGCGCQVIPEAVRAKYYTRNIFENFNAGLERGFVYSMNSHGDYNMREGGNLRQSGQAISDIITLTEDRGAAFTPGSLNYSLSMASGMSTVDDRDMRNDEIHHTLLQKRDGKFLLILWADKDSHTGETGSEAATLRLPGGASQVRIFKPVTNGTSVVSTFSNIAGGGSVNLSGTIAIPDHPIIIEITSPTIISTDRTDAGGTVTASGENTASGEGKEKAFDNSNATKWLAFSANAWIQFRFSNSKKFAINQYTITSANDAPTRDPKNWTLRGSNNGTTWTTVDTRSNQTFASRFLKKTYTFTNTTGYEYYRLEITSNGASITQLAEIELFGPEVVPVTYYRIRSRWQNTYLYDGGDALSYGNLASTDQTSHWTFEEIEGFTRIKNRSTGEYVHIENLLGYVQSTNQAGWSTQWTLEDYDGHKRIRNRWQPNEYIHLEGLTGNAQYANIRADAWSSQWALEQVNGNGRLSAENMTDEALWQVFPNPAAGQLNVQFEARIEGRVQIKLVDSFAKESLQVTETVKKGTNVIKLDVSKLPSGLYLVNIISDGKRVVKKVIIK